MNIQLNDAVKGAQSLEEVEKLLKDHPELEPKQVWNEIEKHSSTQSEKLDLDELEAVSGGADRDWKKDGCAATSEPNGWCWSNDQCLIWDVTYDNFWVCCPDGHEHVWKNYTCIRCNYTQAHTPRDRTK